MEIDDIIKELKQSENKKYVKFISEKSKNNCKSCAQYHNQIFKIDDPNKPQLPLHPNCHCRYEKIDSNELKKIQTRIEALSVQLRKYCVQTTNKAHQLYSQSIDLITQAQNIKNKIDAAILAQKISTLIIIVQCVLFALEKINLTIEILKSIIKRMELNIQSFEQECSELKKAIIELKESLKKLHYIRLKEVDQRPENLPQSPQEAIKRGFILAPDGQNRYHRNKGQRGNKKYYHPITGQEVVFDENGKIVTDPENIGTKNYGPEPVSGKHIFLDMIPYYIWGNSKDDSTPFWRRVIGNF